MDIAQLVECLPSMHEALSSISGTVETRHSDTYLWSQHSETESGGSLRVQDQPGLQSKFQASLQSYRETLH